MKQENILARFDSEIASYERMVEDNTHASMTEKDWEKVRQIKHTISALKLLRTQFACRMFPRRLIFNEGKCLGAGFTFTGEGDTVVTMNLPSDHYDYIGPISVLGKTKAEIEAEVEKYL